MAMTAQELTEWETRLKRDQEKWHKTRSELERTLTRTNADLDLLKDEVKGQRKVYNTLKDETDGLTEKHTDIVDSLAVKEVTIAKLETRESGLLEQVRDLDIVVATKKAEIEKGMSAYATRRRREIDATMVELDNTLERLASSIGEAEITLEQKNDQLATILQDTATARHTMAEAVAEQDKQKAQWLEHVIKTKAEIETVDKELKGLYYKRDQVVTETTKAKEQHDNFIEYEKAAIKALNTKDRELQDRQADLDVGERHLETRRSFLPPM